MINVKNTNLAIKNGAYILDFCPSGTSYGERYTVICYDIKSCLKKYKGWYLFGVPTRYFEEIGFMALRKNMEPKTKNKQNILIGNAMWHINKAVERGNIKIEL